MRIRSPKDLHYPITITSLLVKPDNDIQSSTPLFAYTYQSVVSEVDKYGEESEVIRAFPTEFQSEYEGTLLSWDIRVGDIIVREGHPFCDINEPCRHEVQWGGLCTSCGKDMTVTDYTTSKRNDARVAVSMDARHAELKVSTDEAHRATDEEIKRLLSDRKLSLVVDLDQTVIHATVDPTVGEWQKDPENPNFESLTDVRSFQLLDGGPSSRSCWYYVKMRPGLQEFLDEMSKNYEMHVYTMGTGPYAQAIMKIIDPDRKVFGDRIITRDESGSTTVKNLLKVFPMDQKMVVIIDDRGDVWSWSPNLIKVVPYEFFRGIGDINASFLPKRTGVLAPKSPVAVDENMVVPPAVSTQVPESTEPATQTNGEGASVASEAVAVTESPNVIAAPAEKEKPKGMEEQIHDQEDAIASQIEERPLLKSQKLLDKKVDEEVEAESVNGASVDDNVSEASQKQKHKLLSDDDRELVWLRQSLDRVHKDFFKEYDARTGVPKGVRVAQLKGERNPKKPKTEPFDARLIPDIQYVMPAIKARVLGNVALCFTGVIPQNIIHATSDIGMWAQSFGAIVAPDLTKSTTHVIAHRDRRTSKVRQAARHSKIKIVTPDWLFECFAKWEKVDETPYLIEIERETITSNDSLPIDQLPDGVLLSSEDEDGGNTDIDLGLPDDIPSDVPDDDDFDEANSPIDMTNADWNDINAELDDFLGSDLESGTDDDGDDSDANITPSAENSAKKRKRTLSQNSNSDAEESDASTTSNGNKPGSKLQRRKRQALDRNTSLSNVTAVTKSSGLPSPEATGPEEADGADDGFEDDLEAAMLAEMERESEVE